MRLLDCPDTLILFLANLSRSHHLFLLLVTPLFLQHTALHLLSLICTVLIPVTRNYRRKLIALCRAIISLIIFTRVALALSFPLVFLETDSLLIRKLLIVDLDISVDVGEEVRVRVKDELTRG